MKTSLTPPIISKTFDIVIRKYSPTGPIATTIEGIRYKGESEAVTKIIKLLTTCCITEPGKVTAKSLFMLGDK